MTDGQWDGPDAELEERMQQQGTVKELGRHALNYAVGIDLGGTKVAAILSDLHGKVLADVTVSTDRSGGMRLVEQLSDIVEEMCGIAGVSAGSILATAIGGAGAPVNESGALAQSPNLAGMGGLNLGSELGARLGHSVVVENDANMAALAELYQGVGRLYQNFVFITVGTGIGMGIVLDGRLVRGSHGAAGEIGFLPFGADPLEPTNQVSGPLEEVTAGSSLTRAYAEMSGMSESVPRIFDLARKGEALAQQALDREAQELARAVVAVVAVIDPGVILLGGGIGSRRELLVLIQRWLAKYGYPDVLVKVSEFGGRASVIGAINVAVSTARNQLSEELTA